MKLVESGIGVVVAVIMIFALGQGNLKKNVNGQEEFQPESGTSADISESSTQDMSYSDTEGCTAVSGNCGGCGHSGSAKWSVCTICQLHQP